MPINITTNLASITAQTKLSRTQEQLFRSTERLSSGLRINRAFDDAAGLAISERMQSQIRGLRQASRNANDAVSMLQTAEGALAEVHSLLARMREIGVQAASGHLENRERAFLDLEFQTLKTELNRIADVTEFAGKKLLNGTLSSGVSFQVGSGSPIENRITVSLGDVHAVNLAVSGAVNLSTQAVSSAGVAISALDVIDRAINNISSTRARLGAGQSRLSSVVNTLMAATENMTASVSRIRDADIAFESAEFAATQIRMQAGVAVLAQANQLPAAALQLLR